MKYKTIITALLLTVISSAFAMPFKNIVVALDNFNPDIIKARANIEKNQSEMRTERNLDDPEVELEVMSPSNNSEIEVVVSQDFAFPTKYARMKKAAKLAAKRDSIEYELTRKEVIMRAYEICAEIIYLNRIIKIDSARYEIAKNNFEQIKKGLELGKYSILEVNDCQMEMISAYSNLNNTKRELSEYNLELNALFGNNTTIRIEDLTFPEDLKPCDGYISTYQELMDVVNELNNQQLKVAKAESHPTLSAGYKFSKADDTAHGFVVGSTIPIFSARGKKAKVIQENYITQYDIIQRVENLKAELSAEHHRAEDYEKLIKLYDQKIFLKTPDLLKLSLSEGRITEIEYNLQLDKWYENFKISCEQIKEYNKCLLKMAAYCK